MKTNLMPVERIEKSILLIHGCKVMLDADLESFTKYRPKFSTKQLNAIKPGSPQTSCFS